MFAGDLRRGLPFLDHRLEQRAQSGVDADDVVAGEFVGEDRVGVFDQVVDVLRGRHRGVDVFVPRGVGGADDPVAFPGDDEEDGFLRLRDDSGIRVGLDLVLGHGDVHALGGEHLEPGIGFRQILLLFGPDASGEDGAAGVDVEFLTADLVPGVDARDLVTVVQVADDGDVVGGSGSVAHCRADEGHDEAGVVDLRIVVFEGSDGGVVGQTREVRGQGLFSQVTVHRHSAFAARPGGHRVVEKHAGSDERPVDEAVFEGEHESDGFDEVRSGVLEQQIAFLQRLGDEFEVEHLEVAESAVHELRGPG